MKKIGISKNVGFAALVKDSDKNKSLYSPKSAIVKHKMQKIARSSRWE